MSFSTRTNLKRITAALCAAVLTACAPGASNFSRPLPEADPVLAQELELLLHEYDTEPEAVAVQSPQVALLAAGGLNTAIPQAFAITRPREDLTTSLDSYYITGTSDPNSPVYFGGEEIQRQGTKGTFGVHVQLEMGTNSFTFSQGGQSKTVNILRTAGGMAAITAIRQSSMVPAVSATVKNGDKLSVGCIAPAGAIVQASYGGATVTLTQTKGDEVGGLPATFTGKLTAGADVPKDETRAAGKVQYTMTYKGETTTYTSTGDVYVVGEDCNTVVEVTSYTGFLYPDLSNLGWIQETVKAGARDFVTGQTNEYYQLASGYHIPKEMVGVVTGKPAVRNKLGGVSFSKGAKGEQFVFHGTRDPLYNTWITNNTFYIRFYNTTGTPGADTSSSALTNGYTVTDGEGTVTYSFPLKGLVWGHDVAFSGGDTVLTLRYKPSLSADGTPLSGLVIVVDPGHGGTDPGALGMAGVTGPTEADVNLANAFAIRDRLVQLGAQVVLTRQDDSYLSLDDRMKLIETSGADLFLSVHHNSMGENIDGNKVNGMEVYYHTALSAKFANTMMSRMSSSLGRKNRLVEQSYYRVTLMTHSPALLLELGFMTNPLEYERAADNSEMQKVAQAVSDGIIATLS